MGIQTLRLSHKILCIVQSDDGAAPQTARLPGWQEIISVLQSDDGAEPQTARLPGWREKGVL